MFFINQWMLLKFKLSSYHGTIVDELALDHQRCSSNNLVFASVLDDGDKVISTGFHL